MYALSCICGQTPFLYVTLSLFFAVIFVSCFLQLLPLDCLGQ